MLKIDPKSALLGAALVLGGGLAANQGSSLIQYVFKSGDPIRANEINANFSALSAAIDTIKSTNGASVGTDRLADGSVTASKLKVSTPGQPGQVLALTTDGLQWQTSTGAQGPAGERGPIGPAGAKGAAGAAGPQGSPGVSNLTTVTQSTSTETQFGTLWKAACPAGTRVISGGYENYDGTDVTLRNNKPADDGSGWEVLTTQSGGYRIAAIAVCATVATD